MAALATQIITPQGLAPSYAAAAGGGDTFTPDVDTFIHVKNAGGSPQTVTVAVPGNERYGVATADVTCSVPATTGDRMIGPFPAEIFADSALSGAAAITYTAVTSLTIAVVKAQAY
jgi:hypothetical protein